jgi:hypothetical protein
MRQPSGNKSLLAWLRYLASQNAQARISSRLYEAFAPTVSRQARSESPARNLDQLQAQPKKRSSMLEDRRRLLKAHDGVSRLLFNKDRDRKPMRSRLVNENRTRSFFVCSGRLDSDNLQIFTPL